MTDLQQPRYLYVVVHIPKCAGSTIHNHLQQNIGGDRVLFIERTRGLKRQFSKHRYTLSLEGRDPNRIDALTGHELGRSALLKFPARPIREIALIRDPVSRYLSNYSYYVRTVIEPGAGPAPTFEEWYATQRPNYMTEFFLTRYLERSELKLLAISEQTQFDLVNEAFSKFWYVADYRTCDAFLAVLSQELGISATVERMNVTPPRHRGLKDVSDKIRSRIVAENPVDQAIYDTWKNVGFNNPPSGNPEGNLSTRPLTHASRRVTRLGAKAALRLRTKGVLRA